MRGRRWDDLTRRVQGLRRRDEDGRQLLPGSQIHELRQALFLGRGVADARFGNLRTRYQDRGLDDLAGAGQNLFWKEGGRWLTGLLDAMDAADFIDTGHQRVEQEQQVEEWHGE